MPVRNKKKLDFSNLGTQPFSLRRQPKPAGKSSRSWPADLDKAAEEFIDFLKNSDGKKSVMDFLINSYNKFEKDKITQIKARIEHEKKVNSKGASDLHTPSNLGPLLHEDFNMAKTEQAFVKGLKLTQSNLTHSVEERVEEINRLLANIGGFSAQLKSSFARSTVVFLEQEDPKYPFRERLIFSINLPNYELKRSWDHGASSKTSDGRTSLQATWDEAVNALAKIVENTGLKPKYCKNDRHYGKFVMKQDLRSSSNLPDEYFSFTLDYNTREKIKDMCEPYDAIVRDYDTKIERLEKKLKSYSEGAPAPRYTKLKKEHLRLTQEKDFFLGTTPDPNQLDEGLLFLIEVSTLKDYHIVKDRMQIIMTQYVFYLSKIAAQEEEDRVKAEKAKSTLFTLEDLQNVPQYTIDSSFLKTAKPTKNRKKNAA